MDFISRPTQVRIFFFFTMLFGALSINSLVFAAAEPTEKRLPPKNCPLAIRTRQADFIPINKAVYHEIAHTYNFLEELNKTLFNTAILKQPKDTRKILDNLPLHLGSGIRGFVPLIGAPGKKIPYTFFDRGSKELVIIGGGFANPREMLAPLLGIFVNYNVVIFDHVGHGLDYKPVELLGRFYKALLDIDFQALEGGAQEENEILSIAKHFKNQKNYSAVYGVGFCYSTGLFIRTAAHNPGLFTKLILDGAWESAEALMKRFAEKPDLFFDPQRGSPSEQTMGYTTRLRYRIYSYLANRSGVQRYLKGAAEKLASNGSSLEKLIDTPILFIHGVNDLVISTKQFNTTWDKKAGEKLAILTDGRHLQNHIKYKQLFSWCSNCFLDLGLEALTYSFTSPEALAQTYEALRQCKEAKNIKSLEQSLIPHAIH